MDRAWCAVAAWVVLAAAADVVVWTGQGDRRSDDRFRRTVR